MELWAPLEVYEELIRTFRRREKDKIERESGISESDKSPATYREREMSGRTVKWELAGDVLYARDCDLSVSGKPWCLVHDTISSSA